MKKLFQLVFGDARNVAAVATSVGLAWLVSLWSPAATGWSLAAMLIIAATWQAL
jgi:hypothetical protein